jgi:hypothetical protein
LFKEAIEHGRFAMVNVGNDCNITDFFRLKHN